MYPNHFTQNTLLPFFGLEGFFALCEGFKSEISRKINVAFRLMWLWLHTVHTQQSRKIMNINFDNLNENLYGIPLGFIVENFPEYFQDMKNSSQLNEVKFERLFTEELAEIDEAWQHHQEDQGLMLKRENTATQAIKLFEGGNINQLLELLDGNTEAKWFLSLRAAEEPQAKALLEFLTLYAHEEHSNKIGELTGEAKAIRQENRELAFQTRLYQLKMEAWNLADEKYKASGFFKPLKLEKWTEMAEEAAARVAENGVFPVTMSLKDCIRNLNYTAILREVAKRSTYKLELPTAEELEVLKAIVQSEAQEQLKKAVLVSFPRKEETSR
ncbi:MAG: hypothetical protein ACK53X_02825 [Holosporales bacterium]